jgi:SnoaL-like domain
LNNTFEKTSIDNIWSNIMNEELLARIQRLEDIEAIRNLKARYCLACDDNYNPESLGPLFAEDAVWDAGILGYNEGRDAIKVFFAQSSTIVPWALHYVTNPIIEVDNDKASGNWLLWEPMTFAQGDNKTGCWHCASYSDEYVKVNGEWLFKRVKINIEVLSPFNNNFGEVPVIDPQG